MDKNSAKLTRQNSPGPQPAKLPPCCPNLPVHPNCFAENNRLNLSEPQKKTLIHMLYLTV